MKRFKGKRNIKEKIYRTQACVSIMFGTIVLEV